MTVACLSDRTSSLIGNACQNIKSLSLGNATTSLSSIRNIHGITLGKFPGGHEMQASAAPAYLGNQNLVDPEGNICGLAVELPHADVSRHRV